MRVNIVSTRRIFKEFFISFLKICRMIVSAFVIFLQVLILTVCEMIGFSKIDFFPIFPVLKRSNKLDKLENLSKHPKLVRQSSFIQFQQKPIFFHFSTKSSTVNFLRTGCAGPKIDIHSNKNIPKQWK